jgi:hypothetical protein
MSQTTVNANSAAYLVDASQLENVDNAFYNFDDFEIFEILYNADFDETSDYGQSILKQMYQALRGATITEAEREAALAAYNSAKSNYDTAAAELNNTQDAINNGHIDLNAYQTAQDYITQLRAAIPVLRNSVQNILNKYTGTVSFYSAYEANNQYGPIYKLQELVNHLNSITSCNDASLGTFVDTLKTKVEALFSGESALNMLVLVPELSGLISSSEDQVNKNRDLLQVGMLLYSVPGVGGPIASAADYANSDAFWWHILAMRGEYSPLLISQDTLTLIQAEIDGGAACNRTAVIQEIFNNLNISGETGILAPPLPGLRATILANMPETIRATLEARVSAVSSDWLQMIRELESAIYTGTSVSSRPLGLMARDSNTISLVEVFALGAGTIETLATKYNVDKDDKNALKSKIEAQLKTAESSLATRTKSYDSLKAIYEREKENYEEIGDPNKLLNLATKYNPKNITESTMKVATITKSIGEGGAVQYTISADTVAATQATNVLGAMNDALSHLNIAYYSLAICYERALIVGELVRIQVKKIEDANELVKTNNKFIKQCNVLYNDYYARCTGGGGTLTVPHELRTNILRVGGSINEHLDSSFISADGQGGGGYDNIDVKEQGNLTKISNATEALRMHGDDLSSNVQSLNTDLTRHTQNYNNFLSIATQLCKASGDYFKTITANIR